MNKSNEIAELAKALSKFQEKVKPVSKDATNPFFKSKYATLAGIWSEVKEHLNACGLVIVQGGNGGEGKILLSTMVIHAESGQWIESELAMASKDNSPQADGSAITYGRRYGLSALLSLMTEDDDDAEGAESHSEGGKKTPDKPVSGPTQANPPKPRTKPSDTQPEEAPDGTYICPDCGMGGLEPYDRDNTYQGETTKQKRISCSNNKCTWWCVLK